MNKFQSVIFISGFFMSLLIAKEKTSIEKKLYPVKDVGEIVVYLEKVGEPVSNPYRISIEMKCDKENRKVIIITDEPVCKFDNIEIDYKENKATVQIKAYDPDTGECSKPENFFKLNYGIYCN
jgi:hypothetical protein